MLNVKFVHVTIVLHVHYTNYLYIHVDAKDAWPVGQCWYYVIIAGG
jgi:hypothetical protein